VCFDFVGNKQDPIEEFSHNLFRKQVCNRIVNIVIIVDSVLDLNEGRIERLFLWDINL
jgi:hypothetical protein